MKKNQQGFTLLEVLISISILAIITLSIITITGDSQNIKERVISEDKQNLQIETALSRMEWDFSQLYSPLYYLRELKPQHFITGDASLDEKNTARYNQIVDEYQRNPRFAFPASDMTPVPINQMPERNELIIFTTSNRRKMVNIKQSHFSWIRYAIEDDPLMQPGDDEVYNGKALVRYQVTENPFFREEVKWSETKPQVLLRNIEDIRFSFWDKNKRDFVDNLNLLNENSRYALRGIKVFITWINADKNEIEVEKIFRPLYPEFEPEDLTKYLQANPAGEQTTGTTGSENEGDGEGSGIDDEEGFFDE